MGDGRPIREVVILPAPFSPRLQKEMTMSVNRVYNFAAGPAVLPLPALEEAQRDLLALPGVGMSILEISHRSKAFEAILGECIANIRTLAGVPDGYHILFLQGGATTQFSMVPMNLLHAGAMADYLVTGSWSDKAVKEAKKVGAVNVAFNAKAENYVRVPKQEELKLSKGAAYVHITTNETIHGVEFHRLPDFGGATVVADTSSHMFSRPIDVSKYGLIYAGVQKNLGPSGVTLVIIRDDLVKAAAAHPAYANLPIMLQYGIHAENNSLYNTPNCFGIYMIGLTIKWLLGLGGLAAIETINTRKAQTALRRHRRQRRVLPRPRGRRQPVADERHLPHADRGTRGEVRQGVQGGRVRRPQGPPIGGRPPRVDLQRVPREGRGGPGGLHEGVPEEERVEGTGDKG